MILVRSGEHYPCRGTLRPRARPRAQDCSETSTTHPDSFPSTAASGASSPTDAPVPEEFGQRRSWLVVAAGCLDPWLWTHASAWRFSQTPLLGIRPPVHYVVGCQGSRVKLLLVAECLTLAAECRCCCRREYRCRY